MEQKQLTDEQKKQLVALQRSHLKNSAILGAKTSVLIVLANIFIVLVDVLLVQNQTFVFISTVVTIFMILRSMQEKAQKEHDRVKEEIKKILEQ